MSAIRPILLRDACVVTMRPALGELSRGSVLIEGDRIAAVAPDIEAGDAETIDARGFIVIPGFPCQVVLDEVEEHIPGRVLFCDRNQFSKRQADAFEKRDYA